jgi:hypothetical protein
MAMLREDETTERLLANLRAASIHLRDAALTTGAADNDDVDHHHHHHHTHETLHADTETEVEVEVETALELLSPLLLVESGELETMLFRVQRRQGEEETARLHLTKSLACHMLLRPGEPLSAHELAARLLSGAEALLSDEGDLRPFFDPDLAEEVLLRTVFLAHGEDESALPGRVADSQVRGNRVATKVTPKGRAADSGVAVGEEEEAARQQLAQDALNALITLYTRTKQHGKLAALHDTQLQ